MTTTAKHGDAKQSDATTKATTPDATTIQFVADGRRIHAQAGQSIAGALVTHGDHVLSRSLKFHRPRGYACGTGDCNNCMMRVDGVPNVKTCMVPAAEGMIVHGQNAWPHVRRDLLRAADLVFPKDLDHHHGFVRPRFLYRLFGAVIRAFAGWGRLPSDPSPPTNTVALTPDVLVLGGGPAGMAAAHAAAEAKADVLLIEGRDRLGGHATRMRTDLPHPDHDDALAYRDGQGEGTDTKTYRARHLVDAWRAELDLPGTIDVRLQTQVSAVYRNGLVLAHDDDTLLVIRPRAMVVATGGTSAQALFANNDRPGVMDAVAAQTLLHVEGVRPGRRAVVYGAGAHGLHVARDLHAANIDVAAIVTPNAAPHGPQALIDDVHSAGIPILTTTRIEAVRGMSRTKAVTVVGDDGISDEITADLVVVAMGRKTVPDLFQALGVETAYDDDAGGLVPVLDRNLQTSMPGVFAAGDAAGIGSLATARTTGRLAGFGAASHAGHPLRSRMVEKERLRKRLRELAEGHGGPARTDRGGALAQAVGRIAAKARSNGTPESTPKTDAKRHSAASKEATA